MSHEVNIAETFHGTIDPGVTLEFYDWSGNYGDVRKKARFFTVAPDPVIDAGDGITIEFFPSKFDLEVVATWATVWVDGNGDATFQRNARVVNIGQSTTTYHLLRAETDN